jgi:hypothetical protein
MTSLAPPRTRGLPFVDFQWAEAPEGEMALMGEAVTSLGVYCVDAALFAD